MNLITDITLQVVTSSIPGTSKAINSESDKYHQTLGIIFTIKMH